MFTVALIFIAGAFTGIAFGMMLTVHIISRSYFGTISWTADEDGIYPYVKGNRPFEEITRHKYACFDVEDVRTAYESSNGNDN